MKKEKHHRLALGEKKKNAAVRRLEHTTAPLLQFAPAEVINLNTCFLSGVSIKDEYSEPQHQAIY